MQQLIHHSSNYAILLLKSEKKKLLWGQVLSIKPLVREEDTSGKRVPLAATQMQFLFKYSTFLSHYISETAVMSAAQQRSSGF